VRAQVLGLRQWGLHIERGAHDGRHDLVHAGEPPVDRGQAHPGAASDLVPAQPVSSHLLEQLQSGDDDGAVDGGVGHDVELEFDKTLLVLNKASLTVDGQLVDSELIHYGERELNTQLPDGTSVTVAVFSGMVGELTKAQLRGDDGSWVDLTPR
jgi:hypothetical protein